MRITPLRHIICLALILCALAASAITRRQYKLNLSEENAELREEIAALEEEYNALVEQIAALDSVTGEIFDAIEAVSPDTISLASRSALPLVRVVRDYKAFKPAIDIMYPETAEQMDRRLQRLGAVIAGAQAYDNLSSLLSRPHTKEALQASTDSLLYTAQGSALTKNQKKEIEKLSALAEKEWEDHWFLSELIAEVSQQWPVITDKAMATHVLTDYVYPTIGKAYPGKKQFPPAYGLLNSVLAEFTSTFADFPSNSALLSDEARYQEWLLSLTKKLF